MSAASLNPLPLLVGLVAEAAYLLFVPDSHWYDARLSRRYDAEVERRRRELKEEVLPTLRPALQERFTRLEGMRVQIDAQPVEGAGTGGGGGWFREVLRKLDYLLEKFLMFAAKEAQFRSYLQSLAEEVRGGEPRQGRQVYIEFLDEPGPRRGRVSAPRGLPARSSSGPAPEPRTPLDRDDRWVAGTIEEIQAHYDAQITDLKQAMEQEQDANTKGVLEKRLDVLQRRHEFAGKIGKILTNLNHQLKLLEDTFGLINDEIRARSPEQILADIEDVVWQTDTMTKLLEEVAPYEQMVARMTSA